MKPSWFCGTIVCFLMVCASLAASDSIELRDGRHLQGRYIGGTARLIGFMSSGAVEYFATKDVLALIFDKNADSPLSGLQPEPMRGESARAESSRDSLRPISAKTRRRTGCPGAERGKVASTSLTD